jgi:hypothetical protein
MIEPMTPTDFGDIIEELSDLEPSDIENHVLVVDGDPYFIDDLAFCATCSLAFTEDDRSADSVGNLLCPDCYDQHIADEVHDNDLRRDFRSSR